MSHNDLDPKKIDLFLSASIPFVVLYHYHFVLHPDKLNYGTIRTCLEKGSEYRWEITRGNNGTRTEMTSGLLEVVWKNSCILPLQCEIKTIHEKYSFIGHLNEGSTFFFLTCYFVNFPSCVTLGLYHCFLSETRILWINYVLIHRLQLYITSTLVQEMQICLTVRSNTHLTIIDLYMHCQTCW